MRAPVVLLAASLLSACSQEIVVIACDGHVADAPADAGSRSDAGVFDTGPAPDAAPADAGFEVDAGPRPDAGFDPCSGKPFCLRALTAAAPVVDVRESAVLTPTIDNPTNTVVRFEVDVAELRLQRTGAGPTVAAGDLVINLGADAAGLVTLRVADVPPWFTETRVTVTLHGVGPNGERSSVEGEVVVRGNVAFSAGSEGRVYAVASDGQPATLGGRYAGGILLEALTGSPRALLLSRDGRLVVWDDGPNPNRLLRFDLTGKDVLQRELEHTAMGAPIAREGASNVLDLAELPDGRLVVPEHEFAGPSASPKARALIWGPTAASSVGSTPRRRTRSGAAPRSGAAICCWRIGSRAG
jgi:hypothetical protein